MERRKRVWLFLIFSAATLDICRGMDVSCVDAGFTECCVENCQLSSGCFCDQACYEEDQCCNDITTICSPPPELCGSDPCQNQGTCVVISLTDYTCQCMYGYTGRLCQTDINFCDSNPCLNDGTCTDGVYGFSCECPIGFSSRQCEVNINECADDPCGQFGTCIDGEGQYTCMCTSGFTGVNCDMNINDCDPDPCINGTCIDGVGGYMCECDPSFAGTNCSIMTDCSVEENTCENNGICNVTFDGIIRQIYCICLDGYTGDNCEIDTNECSGNPCINGGTCLDLIGEYSCICPSDFTGENCSIEIDLCDTISCENGAVCKEGECFCRNGFTGVVCELNIDDCLSATCFNNATCFDEVAGFMCQCTDGFMGELCNVSTTTSCSISPCLNGGTCDIISSTEYRCICPPQVTGINCSEMIDFCLSAPCFENNTQSCINTDSGFKCMCIPGYEGEACETDQDACVILDPCANGGVCMDMEGLNYTCVCADGFEGINCGQDINECLSNPCQNNGTCVNEIGQYRCICTPGYSGQDCQEDINNCLSLPCQNNGVCNDLVDGFECVCPNGFTGDTCETNIDNCNPNPCSHNSTCIDLVANYSCECAPGFDGRNCTIDIDLCDPLPCMNGAMCTQNLTQGTIECMCEAGYQGLFCQSDIDECNTTTSLCLNGGNCVNTHGGFYCNCSIGFSGLACEDNVDDDCVFSLCMNNATCIDTGADFECICPPGYTGLLCDLETRECDSDPCQNNGLCLDEFLDFTCLCTANYTGRVCDINLNPCSSTPCLNGAECINGEPGSEEFSCACASGFTGPLCEEDINDCDPNPCLMGSTCIDAINGFICLCVPGFNGSLCDNNYIDNCAYPYCLNGGTCIDIGDESICICDEGFHGPNCEFGTNECLDDPCFNNGICRDLFRGYECMCLSGFTGQACEFNIDDCIDIDCYNGTCRDLVDAFICDCTPGYTGDMCEIEIDECLDVECMFGGSCIDGINNYTCECAQGFQGQQCEENIDDCVQIDCGNGTCVDLVNNYYCQCVMGYTGAACEDMIDECNQQPCMNNGSCVDRLNNFTCVCTEGFTGRYCEININDCIDNDCLNGATCQDGLNDFTCDCVFGYTGDKCETILDLCYDGLCANNGTCNTTSPGITECTCTPLYTGNTCDVYIDLCLDPGRCMNSGECITTEVNGAPSFNCNCTFPFMGVTCESFDPCAYYPCSNYGTCTLDTNTTLGYQCDCLSPFIGYNCLYSDLCLINQPCSNGGACINHIPLTPSETTQSTSCECSPPFTGTGCEIEITPCYYLPCDNGGTCLLDSNSQLGYTCQCPLTWQGINCSEEINIVTPSFNGASFISHNLPISSSIEFNYSMALLTYNVSGLVLFVAQSDSQDYIALGLESGQLVLYLGMESDLIQLRPQVNINDSQWHVIQVHVSEQETSLQVDDEIERVDDVSINSLTDVLVYIGGVPDFSLLSDVIQTVGLVGCVHDRSANGQSVELTVVPHEGRDVGQCSEPVCPYIQCQNGAECSDVTEPPGFTCDCPPFYSGVYCEIPLPFCEPNPCLFGGQCREEFLTFSCQCPLERAGRACEEDISITVPSFSGESYITYPILSPALQTLTVTLTFSPTTNSGLLLFTSTSEMDFSDYFSLALVNGRVEFRYNLGSGVAVIQSETDIELNRWHAVTASLTLGRGELTVDNDPTIVGASQSIFTVLNSQNLVWLGGYTNFVNLSPITGTAESFKGCVMSLIIDDDSAVDLIIDADYGLDVTQCNTSSCSTEPCMNGGTCIEEGPSFVCQCPQGVYGALCSNRPDRCANEPDLCADGATCLNSEDRLSVTCLCPIGRDGDRCDEDIAIQSPQFNTTSYLQYNPDTFGMQLSTVEITFNSSSENGLLFYYGDQNENRDFLSIVLVERRVEYRYDLGSGPAVLISDRVDLNIWHYVLVTLDGPSGTMTVDGSDEINNEFEGLLSVLNAAGDIFVGGVSNYNTVSSHAGTEVGLTGCISDIQINGVDVDLLGDAIDGRGIAECFNDPCSDTTCNNGGSCVVTDDSDVVCICSVGFVGSTCNTAVDISVPYFTGQSYLEHDSLVNVFATTSLTLEIRPSSLNGLILYNQQTIAIDYIAVLLREGVVELRYDLGSGEAIISSRDTIELDEWHVIEVYRSGSSGQLIVDEQLPVSGVSTGPFTGLTLGDSLFIGGVSDSAITDLPPQIREVGGYEGCIRSIESNTGPILLVSDANNGVGIEECPLLPCTSSPCLNNGVCFVEFGNGSSGQQCHCSLPFTGDICAERVEDFPEASFSGQSYLEFSASTVNVNIQRISTSVEITFTPYLLSGLLFYMGPAEVSSPMDYLYIGLSEGLVELRFNLGSGEATAITSQPLLAGETYTIVMNRNGANGMLLISNGDSVTVEAPSSAAQFDYTASSFATYLGGAPSVTSLTRGVYASGLTGCVSTISVGQVGSTQLIPFISATTGLAVNTCS